VNLARRVFVKVARYPLTWLAPERVVRVLSGSLRGSRWIVGSARHAYWLGSYEREKQRQIANELKPGDVFYDLGANVGFYTLLAARRLITGSVYAFEPLPKNIAYLREHLKLNRVSNVELLELAVCDFVGIASFEEGDNSSVGHLGGGSSTQVHTATLDSLLLQRKILPPSLIKIDIEGAELLALKGACEAFKRFRPVLFLATHSRELHNECVQLLVSWGYECKDLGPRACEDSAEIVARPRPGS
jgi:FkbM family methyltransferase